MVIFYMFYARFTSRPPVLTIDSVVKLTFSIDCILHENYTNTMKKKPVQFSNYIYITLFKTKIILHLKLKNKCTNDLRCLRQFFKIHMLFLSLVKLQRNSSGRFFNRSLFHAVYPVEIIMKILICLNVTK